MKSALLNKKAKKPQKNEKKSNPRQKPEVTEMKFDAAVPGNLREIQQWFGGVISQPIDRHSRINPVAPSGLSIVAEAPYFIAPSPTLEPYERIQIYNQQYWWRFFTALQESFPTLVRLFGFAEFNYRIAAPYLVKYPSDHWAICFLGNRLPKWIEEEYHESDKQLILDAADIDWAHTVCFTVKKYPSLTQSDLAKGEAILSQKLYLQPCLQLFEFRYHMFHFHKALVAHDPDYWLEHDFPVLEQDKTYYFVLFRNVHNHVTYEEISQGEFQLLNRFYEGSSIDAAIQWLEDQDPALYDEASSNLHLWLQKWTFLQWLTPERRQPE